jgi:hypothetical protein
MERRTEEQPDDRRACSDRRRNNIPDYQGEERRKGDRRAGH